MASFNKIIILGNVTRDPQLSFLPSQTPVVEVGLAVNRKFKKQDGSQGEEVCFVSAKMFGKRAEVINKYVKKGDPLFIEGRLKYESWKAKDGTNRSKHEIMIENFELMGTPSQSKPKDPPAGNGFGPDDDIPF